MVHLDIATVLKHEMCSTGFNSSVLTTGYIMYVHVVDDFLQAPMYLLVEMKEFYFERCS